MTNLTVGQGKQFSTISAAVSASRDGDVILIDAGTYTNDFSTINTKITLQSVGGLAHLRATASPPDGKAILTTNTDVTINGLEFSGAAVRDGNGAGIRYQGGHLDITNSLFHDNENGILAADDRAGSITIRDSEFRGNGAGDGRTHNLYVGQVGTLSIENSLFQGARVGHEIKSRADNTFISDSRVMNGPDGTGSYTIDLPNGGRAVLTNNVIEQGARSQNPVIVAFGEEGDVRPNSSLELTGNTIVNHLSSPSLAVVWNAAGAPAAMTGNAVFGVPAGQYARGSVAVSGTTVLTTEPAIGTNAPWKAAEVAVPATVVAEARPELPEAAPVVPPATVPEAPAALPPTEKPVAEVAQPAAEAQPASDHAATMPDARQAPLPVTPIQVAPAEPTPIHAMPEPAIVVTAEAPATEVASPVAEGKAEAPAEVASAPAAPDGTPPSPDTTTTEAAIEAAAPVAAEAAAQPAILDAAADRFVFGPPPGHAAPIFVEARDWKWDGADRYGGALRHVAEEWLPDGTTIEVADDAGGADAAWHCQDPNLPPDHFLFG